MSETVDVMICVNEPRNGVYCGRCAGVHISDFIQLDPRCLPEPRCTLREGMFGIHRQKFIVHSHATWVGNWCWDAITLTPFVAARLVATLLSQRWTARGDAEPITIWGIEQADGEHAIKIMDRHNNGEAVSQNDVYRALMASLREAAA